MILVDTGPLVALLDRSDPYYGICHHATQLLPQGPHLTTWPCFTEAMHLLRKEGGYRYQYLLWKLRADGLLRIHPISEQEETRMADLMRRYQDTPMDLADASLIAAAETLDIRQIFSLDRHFYIYRLADGSVLQRIP